MPNRQIAEADAELEKIVWEDEVVRRLCTAPCVGPVTATTFVVTIDGAERFDAAEQVRSYLGLVPREYSPSGSTAGASARRAGAARGRCWWRRPGRSSGGGTRNCPDTDGDA